ncbi:hypothetical protein NC651_010602 [Populus alba x Populus x berolinensis]|nr:hypothetical protein NC651_010602 [Populus alba x Populus x berolinensis]
MKKLINIQNPILSSACTLSVSHLPLFLSLFHSLLEKSSLLHPEC